MIKTKSYFSSRWARISVLMALLMSSLSPMAHDFEVDGIYYKINGNVAAVTFKGNQFDNEHWYSGSVIIPATVTYNGTTYPVTAIGTDAFYKCVGLTSIDIPNSVTSIGTRAFEGCTGLTNIVIPNSVTSIGLRAFEACTGLISIDIPNSVTSIGFSAFQGCSRLTGIVIPNSVTSIGDLAFANCTSLTSIDISNSVTEIGPSVFESCSGLTSIVIPNSVTSIGDWAFANCTSLTSIVIPNSVTAIGNGAFQGCSGLSDVYCYIADLSRVSSGNGQFYSYSEDGDYSGRTLHVLQGTADAYRADENWYPYFGQIVEDLIPETPSGDVNGDGEVNIADANSVIHIIINGGGSGHGHAPCREGNDIYGDVNGDGEVNMADVNAIINIILSH